MFKLYRYVNYGKLKRGLFILLNVLLIASITACATGAAPTPEEIVRELSSNEYEGRLVVGTAGNEKAAQYLASCFQNGGIGPLFRTGYFQEYEQRVAVPSEQQPEILIANADGKQYMLTYGDDYIINAVAEDLSVTMPLSFGIAEGDAKETVPVLPSTQRASQPEGYKILIYSYNELRFTPAVPGPEDRVYISITDKARDKMLTEGAKSIAIHMKAAVRDYTARNVVAAIQSEDRTKAVVFTAHFDHAGKHGSRLFPGALDNASGTAALFSTAVKIKNALKGKKPATDIVFACVNSEECSDLPATFQGSAALVEKLAGQYEELYNINIDCVGGKTAGPLAIVKADRISDELVDLLCERFRANSVAYTTDTSDPNGDHSSFLREGFGSIAIGQYGQSDFMRFIHIEADTADGIDFDNIDRIAASLSEFVLASGAKLFDSRKQINDMQSYKSDDIEWMRRAYRERDRILGERKLKYNEAMYYMYDGELLRETGAGPLTSMEEIRKYYADTSFPESILDYTFDNAVFDNPSLYNIAHTDAPEHELKGRELNQIFEIPTDIRDVLAIMLEYRNQDQYLGIKISTISYSKQDRDAREMVEEPLDKQYEGYSLIKGTGQDKYDCFAYEYGKWCIEVSTYKKMEFPNLYAEGKTDMLPDYNSKLKAKDDMLAIIDALDIQGIAAALISDAGLSN